MLLTIVDKTACDLLNKYQPELSKANVQLERDNHSLIDQQKPIA